VGEWWLAQSRVSNEPVQLQNDATTEEHRPRELGDGGQRSKVAVHDLAARGVLVWIRFDPTRPLEKTPGGKVDALAPR